MLFGSFSLAHAAPEDRMALRGTVRTPGAPEPQAIEVLRIEGVDYLDVNDVARLFLATKYWRAELGKMVLKVDGHRIRLTVGSPYVFVNDDGHNVLAPVRWDNGHIVVPVTLATEVLDPLVAESVKWDRARLQLRIDTGDPNILSIDYELRPNGTVVDIALEGAMTADLELPEENLAIVRVPGGVLSAEAFGSFPGRGLIDSIVTSQNPGRADLLFYLGPFAGNAELLTRGTRLIFAVSQEVADEIPWPEFERTPAARVQRDVKIVTIDPGHGGSDPGIISPRGVPEKAITLAIALRLKDLLADDGFDVRLTREGDRFVSAKERSELANGSASDVMLSIHGNGWFDSSMRGYSVGLQRGAESTPGAEAKRWGERSASSVRDAELLARSILESLGSLDRPSRGTKYGDYAMLEGATMPALVLECGFLTNSEEGATLSEASFHEELARAIASALKQYRASLRQGVEETP
jgi:N-acetylmuramoyl-L-alanine amidase